MHIGLFGGAFDPPHLGHFTIARTVLENQNFDQVWFVPVGQDPFDKQLKANGHRQTMIELGIQSQSDELRDRMRVETFELEKNGKSYSLETLDYLSSRYPEHTFSWILGSDQLVNFHKWKNFQQLLDNYQVWVYQRQNFPLEPWFESMQKIDGEEVAISSSQIRQTIKNNQSISELVLPEIEKYIRQHQLYSE